MSRMLHGPTLRYPTEDLNVEVKDTVEFLKEYLDEAGKKGR